MSQPKTYVPTRKWMVAQVTAVAAFMVAYVSADTWNRTLTIAFIGLMSQALVSYLVPNVDVHAAATQVTGQTPAPGAVAPSAT